MAASRQLTRHCDAELDYVIRLRAPMISNKGRSGVSMAAPVQGRINKHATMRNAIPEHLGRQYAGPISAQRQSCICWIKGRSIHDIPVCVHMQVQPTRDVEAVVYEPSWHQTQVRHGNP